MRNMVRVIQNQIYTAFILFIGSILKFSRQCLENLLDYYHGHIMLYYYR